MALQKRDGGELVKWPMFASDITEMLDLVRENLAGESVTINDLKRIRVPAGGGTIFSVPTAKGDEPAKSLDVVIIMSRMQRAYWPGAYAGKGTPPECTSDDAITGTKYGECAECQFSELVHASDHRDSRHVVKRVR